MDKGITGHWGQYKYYSCIIWLVARHGAHRHKGAVVDCILGGILGYRLVHAENVNAVLACSTICLCIVLFTRERTLKVAILSLEPRAIGVCVPLALLEWPCSA